MAIFISLSGDQIKVSGDTYPIHRVLGAQGLKFKFNKPQDCWKGPSSLRSLETLAAQSGAVMSSDAMAEMGRFQKAAEKRVAYMASKRAI